MTMHPLARRFLIACLVCVILAPVAARAARPDPSIASERPDPATVQRFGPAYRYPRAGWIVLHIEGSPYERGYQHGRLLAPEIADYVKTLATKRSHAAPADAWRETRTMVNALFLRRYDKEYLEEMKGVADGAAAAGATFLGRPLDLLDVVTVNSDIELEFLDSALDATATGLEGRVFREPADLAPTPSPPEHCSAFAATGSATSDGKIVFGHITMFSLYFVRHYNVWLDVKPDHGHRVLMQSYPGGIQSGMDYYLNDAGLIVAETTIKQTKFDINGTALSSRIRKALQYSDSIDKAVDVLKEGNNGMYTNEWLLADTKTNEIAMFELGTHKSKLWRSSKDEWFGGTKGFYWGCNNAKDLDVRLETVATLDGRPANLVWHPSDRDRTWLRLYEKHNGKISTAFGFEAFTTAPLAAFPSCDAKFTTSDLAKDLKTWALFGPPLGKTWDPSAADKKRFAEVQPLVSNDWTLLTAEPPSPLEKPRVVAGMKVDPSANRLEHLKALRDQQQEEVMKLRKAFESLQKNVKANRAEGVVDGNAALVDTYRRWSEELTNVEIRRIAAKAKLDRLRGEKAPQPNSRDDQIKESIREVIDADVRVASIQAELERAEAKLANVKKLVRNSTDPSVRRAIEKVSSLRENKGALLSKLEPLLRQKLTATADPERSIKEAEAELAALRIHEAELRRKLGQLRVENKADANDALRLEYARRDLGRAESILEAIMRVEAEIKKTDSAPKSPEKPKTPVDAPGISKPKDFETDDPQVPHPAAWHGTLLPKADADVWLAAAFADYEKIVAREQALKKKVKAKGRDLNALEKDELAVDLFAPYTGYKTAVSRLGKDIPLSETHAEITRDEWYHIAAGKGVLLLAALRSKLGDDAFLKLMDDFGRAHAGKAVATDDFRAASEALPKHELKPFFTEWLSKTGLPATPKSGSWSIDSYEAELDRTVIVYGTLKESDAQREAAERLQRQVARRWSNINLPILADRDATTEALKGRHILLVGRPDTNSVAQDLARSLPVTFGPASFVIRGETYANPLSAVIAAGPTPADPRSEVVVFAGLSAEATWRCVQVVGDRNGEPTEALVLPAGARARRLVVEREQDAVALSNPRP
jgi:hypothetical protein